MEMPQALLSLLYKDLGGLLRYGECHHVQSTGVIPRGPSRQRTRTPSVSHGAQPQLNPVVSRLLTPVHMDEYAVSCSLTLLLAGRLKAYYSLLICDGDYYM